MTNLPDMLRLLSDLFPHGRHEVGWTGTWPPPARLIVVIGHATGGVAITPADDLTDEQREAIELAATAYRVDAATLRREASCESTGGDGYDAAATGKAAAADGERAEGLFQFLSSTWATKPYAQFSPYNPLAAALAAGWMHAHGRGGEWECQ